MMFLEKRFALCVIAIMVPLCAVAAPSVRSGTTVSGVGAANPTGVRAGTLRTVSKPMANSTSSAAPQEPRMAGLSMPGGGLSGLNKKSISSKSISSAALESLRQEVAALRAEQNQLPTQDWIEQKLNDYATKADFDGVKFGVNDGDVRFSLDNGKTWNTVAPVTAFAGEDGCSPTIVTSADAANRRMVMTINNCNEYTDITYIPFGQDGAPGQNGLNGKDACTPSFSATKTDGVTSIKYSCGEDIVNMPLADIADGQAAELTVQDITRFNLVTGDNMSDYGILTSDNVAATTTIVTLSNRVTELENEDVEAIKSVLSKVSNDWNNLGEDTINMLDK